MGCGASKGAVASLEALEQQRDPEDFTLEPLVLQTTNIEAFDAVFVRLSELLNRLIELNNNVNHAVAEVKSAYAPVVGGYELQVQFVPATDVLLLDVQTGKGDASRPAAEAVARLLSDAAVKAADAELEQARTALHELLASSPTHVAVKVTREGALMVDDAQAAAAPSQVHAVNAALTKLRGLLGTQCHVTAVVRPTTAFGTKTVRAQLFRKGQEGEAEVAQPVTLLEVCASEEASSIKEAEAFLTDRSQHLAHRGKGLDLQWELVPGRRVVLTTAIPNQDILSQVDKILQGVNIALFRLLNSGASSRSRASLTNAVVEVVRPVITALQQRHASSSFKDQIRTLVSIQPAVEFRKEDDGTPPSFDFHFNVELSEEADIAPFPDCLTGEALTLLSAIDNLKLHISGALQELPDISEDVDVLLEEAKEFYELCPEAAARKGFSMMEAVKCSKATGSNLRTLYNTQQLFLAFGENVKRVADELAESPYEIDKLLDEVLQDNLEQ